MQFIRLPKLIDIAERVLPEPVVDWMNTRSVQNITIPFIQKLQVNILISWVIGWSNNGMSHRHTFRNFTNQAWAIWDLSNHDLSWIIPDPGHQKRITLSQECISTIPFQAGTSYVKIPQWGQHCSNHRMPCLVTIFGTFQGTGDQPNKKTGIHFRCTADIFSNITNRGIEGPVMLIARNIGQVRLVGCMNDWPNHRSGRKLIMHIPPPIGHNHRTVYSAIFRVCMANQLKIKVCLK